MRKLSVLAVLVFLAFLAAPAMTTTIINFDDLPTALASLPQHYASGLGVEEWSLNLYYFGDPLPPYNPGSAPNRIYADGTDGFVKFSQLVDFESVWLAADDGSSMQFQGYKEGSLVYNSSPISGFFQGYVNLDWTGIDELHFLTSTPNSAVWDDFKFSACSSVPIPGSLLLLGSGLGMLGIRFRRIII